jgi:actin-related protein
MAARLEAPLSAKLNVMLIDEPKYCAWMGGSSMASPQASHPFEWISRASYDELGIDAIVQRLM